MVKITAKQAKELNKLGVPYGEGGISVTGNKLGHYLCESKKNLALLKKVRG